MCDRHSSAVLPSMVRGPEVVLNSLDCSSVSIGTVMQIPLLKRAGVNESQSLVSALKSFSRSRSMKIPLAKASRDASQASKTFSVSTARSPCRSARHPGSGGVLAQSFPRSSRRVLLSDLAPFRSADGNLTSLQTTSARHAARAITGLCCAVWAISSSQQMQTRRGVR